MSTKAEVVILNLGNRKNEGGKSAVQLSSELQKIMLKVKGDFISEDGREVDYKALKLSEVFQTAFVSKARQLQLVDMKTLERDEKIAFCINILPVYREMVLNFPGARLGSGWGEG